MEGARDLLLHLLSLAGAKIGHALRRESAARVWTALTELVSAVVMRLFVGPGDHGVVATLSVAVSSATLVFAFALAGIPRARFRKKPIPLIKEHESWHSLKIIISIWNRE